MQTRTREESEPEIVQIPRKIQEDIEEKGFHLYSWISPDEVKLSIQRDFLRVLSIAWAPLAVISVILWFISFPLFFIGVIIWVIGIFFFLLYLSLKRSFLLSKSAFVVLTDSSISIGGRIQKLSEISHARKQIEEVEETFEEPLFGESWLEASKKGLFEGVMQQVYGGYEKIFSADRHFSGGRDSEKAIILILLLYTVFVAIMAFVYFIGVFFLLIFGNIFTWLNKKFLAYRGHEVIKINALFGKINQSGEELSQESYMLSKLLDEAQNNLWQDNLFGNLNSSIRQINTLANDATDDAVSLHHAIQSSRYKDMFSYKILSSWIKKQIIVPIEKIIVLLEQNKETLREARKEVVAQLDHEKVELAWALELQRKRIDMQIDQIDATLKQFEFLQEKLTSEIA